MPVHNKEKTSFIDSCVFPMVIKTPFAVGDVYSYLIKDEKVVLIDCGHKSESSYRQVQNEFIKHGLTIADLDEIWLTHGHPDHFGQAALLAEQSGAVIKGHAKERANFAGNSDQPLFRTFFERHHISPPLIDEMLDQLSWLQQFQQPIEPGWVDEGEKLSSGTLNFNVKHTPGHAPGHVVFYHKNGLIFGGDVLLEHISTNALINFDPDSGARNKSLLQYRNSLQWMKDREGRVLPGHGQQITDIAKIATHHLTEQTQRYQEIKALLRDEPRTLMQLSETIFPDALQQGAHFLVFSEIIGYLDWGEQEGAIERKKTGNGIFFEAIHG